MVTSKQASPIAGVWGATRLLICGTGSLKFADKKGWSCEPLEMGEVRPLRTLEVSVISSMVFIPSIFWGHCVCVIFLLSHKL